jgi:hypothetical protein
MDPHQRRSAVLKITHLERDHFLDLTPRRKGKPINPEVPEAAREIRLGDHSKF